MSFVPANAGEFSAPVTEKIQLSERYFLLRIKRPAEMPAPRAGTFINMAVPGEGRFFLRRPFSIHDCTATMMELLIVEAGEGTARIRTIDVGDEVQFYGPLGGGFPVLPDQRIVAIGGGVGLAPLYFYGFRTLKGPGAGYRLMYGARTASDLFLDHIELQHDGVLLATDDGSHGFKGNAVQMAAAELEREPADVIFSCGPTIMMKAAQKLAEANNIKHFVSLENRMACALGACRACVVPTTLGGPSPYRTVCHDGPVFDGADLDWDNLPTP